MINAIGREGLNKPFSGVPTYDKKEYDVHKRTERADHFQTPEQLLDAIRVEDGMTISFHHHLRNGDHVLPMVMRKIQERKIRGLTVAASSIFPCHSLLVDMMKDGTVTKIHADYISGPVAQAISEGLCRETCVITTHGGRPREILEGELSIDIAILAVPACDPCGNATGSMGPSNCGVLGYAIADAQMAKKVVLVTDNLVDRVDEPEILGEWVDAVLTVDHIGDPEGIVSGTTQLTRDPVGLRIAHHCVRALQASGALKNGFSFQTGAGGISLAVAMELRKYMLDQRLTGSFASGGITDALVEMHEEGLFEALYDVQCFSRGATESIARNPCHHKMSASLYANPHQMGNIVDQLDVVILGASEIDLGFNVNVTTGSDGVILGGSGGHADTAAGAKLSVIVTKLVNARRSAVVDRVRTVTTPGETVDLLVTDLGIAVNPKNQTLCDALRTQGKLPIRSIDELYELAIEITGVPKKRAEGDRIVAVSQYRDGTILDVIRNIVE